MGKKKCKKIVLIKGSEVFFDKLEIKKMNNTELLNILKSIYIYFKAKTRQKIMCNVMTVFNIAHL